jgi:hypothetical protein
MYYRNANCAVVVYDITQAVYTPLPPSPSLGTLPSRATRTEHDGTLGVPGQGEGVGQRAATPSE